MHTFSSHTGFRNGRIMSHVASFEYRGSEYEIDILTSDAELDAVEEQMNRFENLNQRTENRHQLAACPTVSHWGELMSVAARLKLFKRRYLMLGFEIGSNSNRLLVWCVAVQSSRCLAHSAAAGSRLKPILQGFGMLERVHPDHRRIGLSQIFSKHYVGALQQKMIQDNSLDDLQDYISWGVIDSLNSASLARAQPLEMAGVSKSSLFVYGGHQLLLRARNRNDNLPQIELELNPSFDFISNYFREQFSPDLSIWEDWAATGHFCASFAAHSGDYSIYCVKFNFPWLRIHNRDAGIVSNGATYFGVFAFFQKEAPVYNLEELPLEMLKQMVQALPLAPGTDFAVIDFDEKSHSDAISYLCENDTHIVATSSEVYDVLGPHGLRVSPEWSSRFLDPRHTSSLLWFEKLVKSRL